MILWLLGPLTACVVVWASVTVKWKKLYEVPIRFHLFAALTLVLGIFWGLIGIPINNVLLVHPVIMTSAALIFGFRLSLIFGAFALVVAHIARGLYWENFGFHYLTGVCTPILVTLLLYIGVQKIRLSIMFFYTLGVGFIGGMMSMGAIGLISLGLLWVFDSTLYWPALDHAYLFFLLAFPEGFCNGVIVSSLAVLRPDLLKTFDEDFYLK